MAPDLGVKYTCFKCGSKFYDLRKPVPICPKCGTDQRESPPREPPPAAERKRVRAKVTPDAEAAQPGEEEAVPLGDEAEEEPEDAAETFEEEP